MSSAKLCQFAATYMTKGTAYCFIVICIVSLLMKQEKKYETIRKSQVKTDLPKKQSTAFLRRF